MAEQHRRAAEEALGEFGEGLLWLVVLDARYALERGDLAEARAQAERGLALAKRTSRAWQAPTLIQITAGSSWRLAGPSGSRPARVDPRLPHLERLRPGGIAKIVVWAQDVAALVASGRLDEAEEVLADCAPARRSATPIVDALTSRSEGLLIAARGELDAAIEAMDQSVGCPRGVTGHSSMVARCSRRVRSNGGPSARLRPSKPSSRRWPYSSRSALSSGSHGLATSCPGSACGGQGGRTG